jgi:hypothetical protein
MYRTLGDADRQGIRLKRLILIGAFASFLGFFGLTVAFDYQGQHSTQVQQVTSSVNLRSLISDDDDDNGGSVTAPQIRTRTS